MTKINIAEAMDVQLDWLVARALGKRPSLFVFKQTGALAAEHRYTTDWSQMGPIIERELLQVNPHFLSAGYQHPKGVWEWEAYVLGPTNLDDSFEQHGPTPLIAAARCYVTPKLGKNVELPEELM